MGFSDADRRDSPEMSGIELFNAMSVIPPHPPVEEVTGANIEDVEGLESLSIVTDRLSNLLSDVRKKRGQSLDNTACPDDENIKNERYKALCTLSTLPPFSYLPESERRGLLSDLHVLHYKTGDVIIQQGTLPRNVYFTAKGRVMLVAVKSHVALGEAPVSFLGYLDAPAHFGEWEPLFEEPRKAQVIAGCDVTAYRMDGKRFEQLLSHTAFRLKLALTMKNKGLFSDIEGFVAVVRRAVSRDMDFSTVLASYRKMVPAIHANLHSPNLDIEGWMYAVRRLPDTITSTYVYLLSNSIPMPFMDENFNLAEISVPSVARRRSAFHVDHSKLLVLMREKFSDVLDFMSLLCAHVHESAKLRLKLTKPAPLAAIHNCLWSSKQKVGPDSVVSMKNEYRYHRRTQYAEVSMQEQVETLSNLPLTEEEIDGLRNLWPNDVLYRIWDIVALHENIQVLGDFSASYGDASDRWAEGIRLAVIELFCNNSKKDEEKSMFDMTDVVAHIISSNTTSVRNLLSPYILKNMGVIYKWGVKARPEIVEKSGISDADKIYALSTAYMCEHPDARTEQDAFDASCFKTLRHTSLTGIQVELIDLDALEQAYTKHEIKPDPLLEPHFGIGSSGSRNSGHRLLVNIDYAFGKQAEDIISALAMLFGESLSSVSVMGKAGGLQGERGDIIVADYLIDQEGNDVTPIDNNGIDRQALSSMSNRAVWSGGVLTVLGTLLQDNRLLQYYKKLYGCVSLEMEGSFYARELMRLKKAKLLSDDLHLRFCYYVSDTPISKDQTETLSTDLDLTELIPPQYAVTRELIRLVLSA